jgi:hypothetical protein
MKFVELGGIELTETVFTNVRLLQIALLTWAYVNPTCWLVLADAAFFYRVR